MSDLTPEKQLGQIRLLLGMPTPEFHALTAESAAAWRKAASERLDRIVALEAEVERLSKGYHETCIAKAEGLEAALKTAEAEIGRLRQVRDGYLGQLETSLDLLVRVATLKSEADVLAWGTDCNAFLTSLPKA